MFSKYQENIPEFFPAWLEKKILSKVLLYTKANHPILNKESARALSSCTGKGWMYYFQNESECFTGYPNSEKRVENTTHIGVFFDEIGGVWIADETLSQVYDISFQSKQKQRSKRRRKMVIYKLRLGIQTSFTVLLFFVLPWWIINEFEKLCSFCFSVSSLKFSWFLKFVTTIRGVRFAQFLLFRGHFLCNSTTKHCTVK